jgi:hypothetical protein
MMNQLVAIARQRHCRTSPLSPGSAPRCAFSNSSPPTSATAQAAHAVHSDLAATNIVLYATYLIQPIDKP